MTRICTQTRIFFLTLAMGLFSSAANASLIFEFSFDNEIGSAPGTVSGKIYGLEDNASGQAASSVIIESFPLGLPGIMDGGNDATAWSHQYFNSFDVLAGEIIGGGFVASHITADPSNSDTFSIGVTDEAIFGFIGEGFQTFYNGLTLNQGETVSGNDNGDDGLDFDQIPVPAPAALTILGIGLVGLGLSRRKKTLMSA